jgi:DNA-binding SARP family transcriptional activator
VEFLLLGPLEVRDGSRRVPLGGVRQRSVLALLLLDPNHVVPADRIVDELWGEAPPATAVTAVQVYVSRLRKELGHSAIETREPGYVLEAGPPTHDLLRFEAAAAAGRKAIASGDLTGGAELLRVALAEWRGPALADLARAPFACRAADRLEELRLAALEDRIEADLALGRHADVLDELNGVVAANPLREGPRSQLMLALYRAGRQAEALEVYRAGRQALVEALAIEPGAELRRLELAILAQDPALDLAPSRRAATVIFADLGVVGLHEDPERGRDELRRAADAAIAAVAALGGTLQEGIAGAVLALFDGDDHLARALAAAVSLRDGAASRSARLAVETGEVVAGGRADGGAFVVGAPVGAAALLVRSAQPGEIVVGDAAAGSSHGGFELRTRTEGGRLLVRRVP